MIRVFPRKTEMTPKDDQVYFTGPPLWDLPNRDVAVSCTFTKDKHRAENLAKQWEKQAYNVSLGGPAYGDQGGEFVSGRFLKHGMVITSRGCNNNCWFCSVPGREGKIRELKVTEGFNLLDNNLLQCSESHIREVLRMLRQQTTPIKLTGGLEAALLKDWHVDLIVALKPKPEVIYFAYDTLSGYYPLQAAAYKMKRIGFGNQRVGCYVLIGWPADTIEAAQKRLQQVVDLDMMPYAMLYENEDLTWRKFQRQYTRPQITRKLHKGQFGRHFQCTDG